MGAARTGNVGRFPRVGGDRPHSTPPPYRNSIGSPAWAGIDPSPNAPWVSGARFPRVGGDRPIAMAWEADGDAVPPRGRG